jgi:hypothetical protein
MRSILVLAALLIAAPAVAQPTPAKPAKPKPAKKPDVARVEPGTGWWCVSAWVDRDGMNAACARTEAACKTIAEAAKGLEQPPGQCKKQRKAHVATVPEGDVVVMRTRADCKVRRDRIAAGGAPISACSSVGRVRTAEEEMIEERAAAFAMLLTSADEGEGAMARIDSARPPGADLGAQLDAVREAGGGVSVGSGSRGARGDGDARVGSGIGPRTGLGSGTAIAGGTDATGPTGRIAIARQQAERDTTLTAEMVVRKIQAAYMAGVKRCYKAALAKDPTLRGTLALSLIVNETGRTVNGAAKGVGAELDACVTGLMAGWRFPIPKDADGEPTDTSFTVALTVVPD